MKKLFLALSVFSTVGLSATPANDETKVDPRVKSTFQKEFSFARNVKWVTNHDASVTTAVFSLDNQSLAAYFNRDGELIGSARSILFNQLPLSVIRTIDKIFSSAEIYDVSEFSRNGETSYYMEATIKNKKYLLQAFPTGQVTIVKRIRS